MQMGQVPALERVSVTAEVRQLLLAYAGESADSA
jgi:hypothetical protein